MFGNKILLQRYFSFGMESYETKSNCYRCASKQAKPSRLRNYLLIEGDI